MNFYNILAKFDLPIIFCFASINLFFWWLVRRSISKLHEQIYPAGNKKRGIQPSMEWTEEMKDKIEKKRNKAIAFYSAYSNLTAIFPLLGILGTVASLSTFSKENMMDNFNIALTTTLWGVFFAIIFRVLDSFISGKLEQHLSDADDILHKTGVREEKNES